MYTILFTACLMAGHIPSSHCVSYEHDKDFQSQQQCEIVLNDARGTKIREDLEDAAWQKFGIVGLVVEGGCYNTNLWR